jgi:hypothetical protein
VAILFAVRYRWNDWNQAHIADHRMLPADAEWVVNRAKAPYPQIIGLGKRLVIGQMRHGVYAQVIYVLDEDGTAYVLHCRPLTDSEKRRYRRRTR